MKHSVELFDSSGVAECRRLARRLAEDAKLDADRVERVAIVATEAATNLLRHAGRGHMLLQAQATGGGTGSGAGSGRWIALAAVDNGRGIPDVEEALRDGFSTGSSAGTGLGAMKRLSDHFEIHSVPGRGTALLCEFGHGPRTMAGVQTAGFLMNHPREDTCGDAWTARNDRGVVELLLVDGLGHGPRAQEAGFEALAAFGAQHETDPAAALNLMSAELAGTRGSVGSLARIEAADGRLSLAGVGNVSAVLVNGKGEMRRLISREGRLGGAVRNPPVEEAELKPGDTLIMHTDGLASLRVVEDFPMLLRHSCAMVGAVLMRDQNRGRDDAGIVVARLERREEDVRCD